MNNYPTVYDQLCSYVQRRILVDKFEFELDSALSSRIADAILQHFGKSADEITHVNMLVDMEYTTRIYLDGTSMWSLTLNEWLDLVEACTDEQPAELA